MTDGNTGFRVAPITEEDMNRLKEFFQRALDSVVGMSQLSADVDMLRSTVTGLQADTERLRNQNNALDEALNHSRAVRDDQARKLADTEIDLQAKDKALNDLNDHNHRLDMANGQLQIDLDLTRRDKDDAEFKVLELEDKLAQAEAKLAKVAELHRALFPVETPPSTPYPEPVQAPEPYTPPPYNPEFVSTVQSADPAPVTDTRPDSREDWAPGYIWDRHTMKYWREGVTPYGVAKDNDPFA